MDSKDISPSFFNIRPDLPQDVDNIKELSNRVFSAGYLASWFVPDPKQKESICLVASRGATKMSEIYVPAAGKRVFIQALFHSCKREDGMLILLWKTIGILIALNKITNVLDVVTLVFVQRC